MNGTPDDGRLFDAGAPAQTPRLGPNQTVVLAELRLRPLTPDEAGALVHRDRGCEWCGRGGCMYVERDGRQVLESLRKHGFAERIGRSRTYRSPGSSAGVSARAGRYDPAAAEIPF